MLDFDISWVDTAKKYIDAAQKLGAGSDDPLASLSFLRMMSYAEVASLAGIEQGDSRAPRCGQAWSTDGASFRAALRISNPHVLRWLDSREAA